MTWSRRWGIALGLLLSCGLSLAPGLAQASHEPFAVYEDWQSAPEIRGDRWSGLIDSAQEVERRIQGHHLVMRYRKVGLLTIADVGSINAFHRLTAANPVVIDQLEADVEVNRFEVSGCAANVTPSATVPAALTLTKFNDGTAGGPGNGTGDHLARIRVRRVSTSTDPEGVLAVEGSLFRCGDPACVGGAFVFLERIGTVTVGERFTLRLIWDSPNNQFIYGVGDLDVAIPYAPGLNVRPAFGGQLADLRMQATVANCTTARTEADAEIKVYEIRANASAVIP